MKKIISIILLVLLLAQTIPAVFAAEGTGNENSAISIELDKPTAVQGEYVNATIRLKNVTAQFVFVPIHFNPEVVQIVDTNGHIVLSGNKTSAEMRDGSAGITPGQALSNELNNNFEPVFWNGGIFENEQYPVLHNETGFYRLCFYNAKNRRITNETLITIRFVTVGAGNADIRFATSADGEGQYDIVATDGALLTPFAQSGSVHGVEDEYFSAMSAQLLTVTASSTPVDPPAIQQPGGGGNGSGNITGVITPPSSEDNTLVYELTIPQVENLLSRAFGETNSELNIKIDADSNITKFIIKMPVEAVDMSFGALVFETKFITPIGSIGFDNLIVLYNAQPSSQFVICTLSATEKSVTIDGVPLTEILTEGPEIPVTVKSFIDLPTSHWAYSYVMSLVEKGVINGMDETHFAPDENVTREQFAKMLVEALEVYDQTATCDFNDLDTSHWAYAYVASAVKAGLITGYDDGTFGIGRNITRQEMAVMVSRCDVQFPTLNPAMAFTDSSSIAGWANAAVQKMQMANIISGFEDKTFKPQENATRAQAAKIIYGVLELID